VNDFDLAVLIVGKPAELARRLGCSRQNLIERSKGSVLNPDLAGRIELAVRAAVAEDPEAAARADMVGRLPTAEAMSPGRVFLREPDGGLHLTIGRVPNPVLSRRKASRPAARVLTHGRMSSPIVTGRRRPDPA
jgi:hypothetical protein